MVEAQDAEPPASAAPVDAHAAFPAAVPVEVATWAAAPVEQQVVLHAVEQRQAVAVRAEASAAQQSVRQDVAQQVEARSEAPVEQQVVLQSDLYAVERQRVAAPVGRKAFP